MNNWKLEITLKSGKELSCYYKGPEDNSTDVANKVLDPKSTFNGFGDKSGLKNILIRTEEIAAITISVA